VQLLNELVCKILAWIPRIIMVNPEESGVRVTLGKYMRDCGPGWYIIWPLIQELDYIVVTPTMTDISYVDARTKDGTLITVGVALVYHVANARSAIFNVDSFEDLLNTIGPDAARKCIEESTNEELQSIENIRKVILDEVRSSCRGWGLKIDRVLLPCCTSCKTIRVIGQTNYLPDEE
jgi:regulator of protease activity HflC (stomatin/prohibitin superfamily)